MIILEENFKRHLEAFASELFKYIQLKTIKTQLAMLKHVCEFPFTVLFFFFFYKIHFYSKDQRIFSSV